MAKQTIQIHTRFQDQQDGSFTFYGYTSEDELIKDHPSNTDGNISNEMREKILNEFNPYEDGYIGKSSFDVDIDENGKVKLFGKMCFSSD